MVSSRGCGVRTIMITHKTFQLSIKTSKLKKFKFCCYKKVILRCLLQYVVKIPSEQYDFKFQCPPPEQSQKTQGFCVADFVTLSDERRSRSKIILLFNMDKRTLRSKI